MEERARVLRSQGFSEDKIPTMLAISQAESGGNPRAHNPNASTGDNSYGLFQVNMLGGMGPERRRQFGIKANEELFDPATNARAAKGVLESQGFGAWSVFKGGQYKQHLSAAEAATRSTRGQSSAGASSPAPRSSAPKPTLAGVESLQGANPMSAILAAGLGGSVPLAQGPKFAGDLDTLTKLIMGEGGPAPQQAQFSQRPAETKPLPAAPPPSSDTIGLAAVRALMGGSEPSSAPQAPAPEIAADTSFTQPPAAAPAGQSAGKGAAFERPESITFDSGQPGIDLWFKSKQFPALLGGTVKDIGRQGGNGKGYGNFVVVEGQDPLSGKPVDALYAHLADGGINVKVGDQVQAGQTIGTQGGTGRVVSADGTIASFDLLAPAPRGSGSMTPFSNFDPLRRHLAKTLRPG